MPTGASKTAPMPRIRFVRARSGETRRRVGVRLTALVTMLLVGAVGPAAPSGAVARGADPGPKASMMRDYVAHTASLSPVPAAPLQFGIYPGGAAGTVGPSGQVKPEVAALRLAALEQLRGDKPFAVHLYESYTRPADGDSVPSWLADQILEYTANGFEVDLVLAYRPVAAAGDSAGFAAFARRRVRQLGGNRGVTSLQVTNEANIAGAPNAADGAYRGASDALVKGVIAAKDEVRRGGFTHLQVGFNWAYGTGKQEASFWSTLGKKGGRTFASAVDWVGLDAYPGTWGPPLAGATLGAGARSATLDALRALRSNYLPRAGLGDKPLHFSESGYPTGSGRTEQMQVSVLRAVVAAIVDYRQQYDVTAYRWFDLRDADSANPSFESQYGITRDDYSPKAGFSAYHDLVATFG
ncbi:MAG: hypothetical protein JWO02_286 [Solirubrobacterales bacterium]|nr:hypothetical protein [Solirubrobacterales bacterium]